MVKWNEPYQKLASCDSTGIIFVWIKYEGRWSIELINDRSTPVTSFAWSHDGRMALICYQVRVQHVQHLWQGVMESPYLHLFTEFMNIYIKSPFSSSLLLKSFPFNIKKFPIPKQL